MLKNKKLPLVSIWIVTYNQEQYIRECLENVLSQQTNFDFEVIIGEDCSTDNTRNIVKEFEDRYPAIIKAVYHERNVGVYRNAYEFCYPLLQGKYVACLEGDDYWEDNKKLQKQVDFLESNPDYSICWTKYKILQEGQASTSSFESVSIEPDWHRIFKDNNLYDIDLNNVFNPYAITTLTTVFRRTAFNLSQLLSMKNAKDNTIYCICLTEGKGAILNFFAGIYRVHGHGVYSGLGMYRQRYSSFLNIQEIIETIPKCNTPHLLYVRNHLLQQAFNLAIEDTDVATSGDILKLSKKIFYYLPLKEKLRAAKRLVRSKVVRQKLKVSF